MKTIEFLGNLRPNGPWLVVAIHPTDKSKRGDALIKSKTIASLENLEDFLCDHDGWNIYYSLNPTMQNMDKKPKRDHIACVEYLHVDIDPRPGEDLEKERTRIEKLVRELPDGVPRPTAVVFSGGGYNLLWKLEEPIPIHGDLAKAEDAKLYNLRLESILGGDACHNIDRILRLPGTMNHPNEKKRKRGRVEAMSKLVYFNPELVYPIERFQKAQLVGIRRDSKKDPAVVPTVNLEISGNIARLSETDMEALGLPTKIETLILYGKIPDSPYLYPSRSEALFAVVCAMVRKDVSDDTIYSIITDPEFEISASVLDKGSSVDRYARWQIQRAKERAIDPNLMEMNDKYSVIENLGGKVRVVRFVPDAVTGLLKVQRFTFGDFENMLMHDRVQIPSKRDNAPPRSIGRGEWWLSHQNRRQYQQMVFAPGQNLEGALNLWQGFAYDAKPPAPGEKGKHESFLSHVLEVVCLGVQEHYDYLVRWMARAVQKPATAGFSVVVLRGGQGTGKGLLAREFGKLFGPHFKHVSDVSRITGQFNLHLQDCVVLFGDEIVEKGDRQHAASLKRLATEPTLDIRALYHDAEQTPNYLHILLASNEDWVVPVDMDDRRMFVLEIGEKRKKSHYSKIFDDLADGGRENLLYFLQTLDISDFDVTSIPQTDALAEQKMRSMNNLQAWWFEKLERGHILEEDDGWLQEVPVDTLKWDYRAWLSELRGRSAKAVSTFEMGNFLTGVTRGEADRQQLSKEVTVIIGGEGVRKSKPYFYLLPTVKRCRQIWDKMMRTERAWADA